MNAPKKIPLRRCLGCGESKPKPELIRIVRSPDGEISLDATGKKSGRGAYICRRAECLLKAKKTRRADKCLETEIPQAIYDVLEKKIKLYEEQA